MTTNSLIALLTAIFGYLLLITFIILVNIQDKQNKQCQKCKFKNNCPRKKQNEH